MKLFKNGTAFLIDRIKIFKVGKNKFTTLPKLLVDYRLMFKKAFCVESNNNAKSPKRRIK